MKQRSPASRSRKDTKPIIVQVTPWIFLGAFTVITVLFAKYYQRPPASVKPGSTQTNAPARSEAENDRSLRQEQLQAAQKLTTAFPENDDAIYLAGLVSNDQGDSERAVQLWKRSLELDPSRADANESIGYALFLRDQHEEAEGYFRQALQIDPALASARLRLAQALSEQGKMPEIIKLLARSTPLTAEAHRWLGDAHLSLQEYAQARTNYEAAIKLNPNFSEAYYGLSKALARLGETDESQLHLETFSRLKAESEERARQVRAQFDSLAVTKKSVAQTHTDIARIYLIQGRPREAEELWTRAAELDTQNSLCRLQLAVLCQQTKRDQEALKYYRAVAQLDPSDGLVQLNLGRVCLKLKLLGEAASAFRHVIRLAPERPDGYSALARLYLQTNTHLTEVPSLVEKALQLAPDAASFELLSQTKAKQGDYAGALAAINKSLELEPGNPRYRQLRELLSQKK